MEPLAPELEKPRARVDRRVLVLCGTASIAFASAAVIACHRAPPCRVPVIVPAPIVIASPPPAAPDVEPAPPDRPASGTDELARFVDAWLADANAPAPSIEYRRGVVFIESEEDRGDDPPYPSSAGAEAQRVCGSAAVWLRDHLRAQLAYHELVCAGTTCSYPGMEYAPTGELAFHKAGDGWVLESWTQIYSAGLGQEYAEANLRFVERATKRLAKTSCAGEPDGAY